MDDNKEAIRLQVYLAHSGIGSRRKCEEFISQGRVSVNGKIVREQGIKITDDSVSFDGRPVYPAKKKIYLALNKPIRYVCTSDDPDGRPTALDLVKNAWPGRIYNVGRLDYMSSGLILFTNDGEFTKIITHPSSGVLKTYLIETREEIKDEDLEEWKKGVRVKGIKYQISDFSKKSPYKVEVTLAEGKNREIRNLFASRLYKIKKLHRIMIGNISIKGIKPGEYRYLNDKEVSRLLRSGDGH